MDSSGRVWPRADLRAGDADRQAVIQELQRHYVDGRLTSDELSERVATILNAKTFADLSVPLSDLPQIPREIRLADPSFEPPSEPQGVEHLGFALPIAAVLVMAGLIMVLSMLLMPGWHRMGFFPFWPIMIWGLLFLSRPHSGGRRRH